MSVDNRKLVRISAVSAVNQDINNIVVTDKTRIPTGIIIRGTKCEEDYKSCKQRIAEGWQDVNCPTCSEEGFYEPVWSDPNSSVTFYRDPYTGETIPGTRIDHGRHTDPSIERKFYCRQAQEKLVRFLMMRAQTR